LFLWEEARSSQLYLPQPTLWAVNNFDLWTIDVTTGVGTHVTAISNIDGPIMGIMFDVNDVLYATSYTPNSSLFTINTTTGLASLVGSTALFFAHGGDFRLALAAVPEPMSLGIWAVAGLASCGYARKRRRASA